MATVALSELRGMARLRRALDGLAEDVRREVAEEALSAGAQVVAEAARQRVPVRTGRLRDSIEWVYAVEDGVPAARVGPGARTRASRREGFWGRFVELGTVERQTRGGVPRGRGPSRPFLRPALEESRDAVIGLVRERLREAIERRREE